MSEQDWWAPWQVEEHFRYRPGSLPLLISLPHDGSEIPGKIAERMYPEARRSPDTDWRMAELYDFARELGAHLIRPRWSRYVVDLNRPPDGAALYPGRAETGLCPTVMFGGSEIYRPGLAPDATEIQRRVEKYWRPYHQALDASLQLICATHGHALLWEGHSIPSECPMFFDGRLPDYNLGTAGGASCEPAVEQALAATLESGSTSFVINGRFKGGYITRHFGEPLRHINAVQMEMTQASYLDERHPQHFDAERASTAQALLRELLLAGVAAMSAQALR